MAKKKKATENDPTPASGETGPEAQPDYPVRPGPHNRENPLEQLINEWDPENPQMIEEPGGDPDILTLADLSGEKMEESIHSDEYKRITPEEFDEFDSLMDEDSRPLEMSRVEAEAPQLRLLEEDEVGDVAPLFDEGVEASAAGEPDSPPVDILEADDMGNDSPEQESSLKDLLPDREEPPPNFEDRGMGGGFFVPEDELQPAGEAMEAEEFDAPVPEAEDGSDGQDLIADLFFPPGPTMEIHPAPAVVGDLPADAGVVETAVTDDRISKMMRRSDIARTRINDEIDSIELARELLELIRSGTTLILSGKANYEEAERSLNEVEYRLSYARRVKVWSDAHSYKLLAYEVFWLLFLGLGALFIPSLLSAMIGQLNSFAPNSLPDFILMDDLFLGVSTALWGGLGGVVGAMYSLWRHVSLKQDFNPQHKMWYYTQPIMGIPIGVVIFLLVRIGIGYTVAGELDFASPYAIYMMAWIAGFQQNILYEIIRQILKLFRIQK